MKRKFLEDMGVLSAEQIDSIMTENGNDINAAKGELTTITTERDNLKNQVKDRDTQIENLKKTAGDNAELTKQIEQLQAENKATKINAAVEAALMQAKAKNVVAVKALLKDLDKAELADDGTIKGLDEQIKTLKGADDTKFLFDTQTQKKPSIKGATPAEPGDPKPQGITKEQFNKMGYKERLKLFNEDKETYDALLNGKEE